MSGRRHVLFVKFLLYVLFPFVIFPAGEYSHTSKFLVRINMKVRGNDIQYNRKWFSC